MIDADVGEEETNRQAPASPGPPSAGPTAGNGHPSGAGLGELCACEDGAFIGAALPAPGPDGPSVPTLGLSRPVLEHGPRQAVGFGNA